MPEGAEERTEAATPKRRSEAREKGNVAKSMDTNSAVLLMGGLSVLTISVGYITENISTLTRNLFSNAGSFRATDMSVRQLIESVLYVFFLSFIPVAATLMVIGIAVSIAQVGFKVSWGAVHPNFARFNPLEGIKRIFFSVSSLVELGKNLLKVTIVGLIAFTSYSGFVEDSLQLIDGGPQSIGSFMANAAFSLGMKVGAVFLVIAAADFIYQRYQFEKNLKMSKMEVKDEYKQLEGDPAVKGRIKSEARRIAYGRMIAAVPKADVVVTNPTHFAVALAYQPEKMFAPHVLAKGADHLAKKIKEVANEHNIPIVEDKELARTLYKSVDVGDAVPEKLFQVVAQLLAYIYRLKRTNPLYYYSTAKG
jgi:flagellar biosynthetic protein FlhB